ncbi:hypothetical protein [Pseudomonas shirazensis]
MLKNILNLDTAQKITKIEQKKIKGGIPECWVYAIEAGCILISVGQTCPLDTTTGLCDSNRLCC